MDYRIARGANIVLGLACVGLETYAFINSIRGNYEKLFWLITAFYVLEAVVFLIWFSNKTKQIWEICWRVFSSFVLIAAGSLMIWSTVELEENYCQNSITNCQFEIKLAAASVAIANGFFYLLARPRAASPLIHQNYAASASPGVAYGHGPSPVQKQIPIQQVSPSPPPYIPPPFPEEPQATVFIVPRAHLIHSSPVSSYTMTQTTSVQQGQPSYHYPPMQSNAQMPANTRPPYRSTGSFQKY